MSTLKKYVITLLCGFAGVAYILWLKDAFGQTEIAASLRIWCDGFFVVGTVLVCLGLLIFTSNEGTLDGLVYGVKSFINLFRKIGMKSYETYYDYKAARAERKTPFGFLVFCGLGFLVVSVVLLMFYHQYQ